MLTALKVSVLIKLMGSVYFIEKGGNKMNMLTCDLNRFSEVPLYEQLYSHIKKEIIDGRLLYGTKLPSNVNWQSSFRLVKTLSRLHMNN